MTFLPINPYALLQIKCPIVTPDILYSELKRFGINEEELISLDYEIFIAGGIPPLNEFVYSGENMFEKLHSFKETKRGVILDSFGNELGGTYLTGSLLPYLLSKLENLNNDVTSDSNRKGIKGFLLKYLDEKVKDDLDDLESRL